MSGETPFFYYASRAYEGYETTTPSPITPSPTPAGTPSPSSIFDSSTAIYPLPFAKSPADIAPNGSFTKAIDSNMAVLPNTCQQPPALTADDIFTKADDLAKATGSAQVCTKSSNNNASQNSSSFSAHGEMSAFIASASMTAGGQHSETAQSQQNAQSGCGSSLTNATNVLMKQSQMQCVINNVSQTTTASAVIHMGVSITTTPLTSQEMTNLAALQSKNADNMLKLRTSYGQLIQGAVIAGAPVASIQVLSDFQTKVLTLADLANTRSEEAYSRDLNMTNVKISQTGSVSMKLSVQLSTSAQATLSSLASSVSKDVTSQALANTFGTSVLDPNVKQASSSATDANSASASSSISNVMNNTSLSVDQSGNIVISCPGKLTLTNVTIDQNFVASVIANAVLNQAITNGLSAATNFLADTTQTQSVANKVAGIDDLQNALNAGVIGAINAGNAPVTAAVNASSMKYIIGAIVGLVALFLIYKLFFAGKSGGSQGPLISADVINALKK